MTILVTGATGTVGRHMVEQLVASGQKVRALTRNPGTAGLPAEVEVVAGDLAVTETLAPVFAGVTAAHLINFGGADYAPLENGQEIVDLVVRSGVRRVTVLGGRADGRLEQAVMASGLEWTFLSPVEFMSNTLKWWAEPVRAEGKVREPFAHRLSALVHEADIAATAVRILLDGGHGGRTHVLTGPEALTIAQRVAILGAAAGREIGLVELTVEEAKEKWRGEGTPEPVIEFLVRALGDTPAEGYTVVPTVAEITGRPARTFAQWAAEHADAFRA